MATPLPTTTGYTVPHAGPGWCEAALELKPWHLQQTGIAPAG